MNLFIPGIPRPQGSKRHVGGGRLIEQSKHLGPWRRTVIDALHESGMAQAKIDGPVSVQLSFHMPRPQYHYNKHGQIRVDALQFHIQRPDVDKLARAILDSLTIAAVISDDSIVAELYAAKYYANSEPGVQISINRLTQKGDST